MGLFDKLRDTVNSAVDTVQGVDHSKTQRYYDIIFTLLSIVDRLTKESIQTYFKVQYNEVCDDAALDKALSKFDSEVESRHQKTWYMLTFQQWKNKRTNNSNINKDVIYDICFKDYIDNVKEKFEEILQIVSENPSNKLFKRGLDNLEQDLQFPRFDSHKYPYPYLAGKVMGSIMVERFWAMDKTVQTIVIEAVCDRVCGCRDLERVYAFALRALHFNEFGKDLNEYSTITEEDCYNAVINSPAYKRDMMELTPFDNKEAIIGHKTKKMINSTFFNQSTDFDWATWAVKDIRFVDAACYYTWKKISENFDKGDTADIEFIVNVVTKSL